MHVYSFVNDSSVIHKNVLVIVIINRTELFSQCLSLFKGIVHLNQVVSNLNEFLSSAEHKTRHFNPLSVTVTHTFFEYR